MSLQRTNVYADPADLALIKEAAAKRGVSEAEIIRHGIHLAAMSTRVWADDMEFPTFDETDAPVADEVTRAVAEGTRYR
ncbi:ribbon-helix-helix domain-containing protein [Nocardia bovistercoris]|uniref:Ribbon-helix-helix protein, CopG family n=1 Tax=Nocardia bovistercoris TaxID=2785916 RepID=A0A931IK17_9NOCA|nr:CopG family transcriptional regulator [Nocardia bovistercoris]MBH0781756.1 ribbon-helix-helix protein, CopG family [Nocardia bovistercoris]